MPLSGLTYDKAIFPDDDIDPNMTVQELFRDGPIEIKVKSYSSTQARFTIRAPKELLILRDELV